MFDIEPSEMHRVSGEGRDGKINASLAAEKGTTSGMGFASATQQLPNNPELKNYNNTDEDCEGF